MSKPAALFHRFAPPTLDNVARGSPVALWLFLPVLALKTLMGFNFSGFNPLVDVAQILSSVDGVPLDTFSGPARAAVLQSAAAWGMALFVLCLVGWIIVLRYRSGAPLAIGAVLLEQAGRSGAGSVAALASLAAGHVPASAGTWINLVMNAMLALAFALSLLPRRKGA